MAEFGFAQTRSNTVTPAGYLTQYPYLTGPISPLLKRQYSIFLYDAAEDRILDGTNYPRASAINPLDPSGPIEYFFTVAPKVFEMDEPFATQIVATQGGGKFVESHGSILKPIRLQGTTGIRPDRKSGAFSDVPLIGNALDQFVDEIDVLGDALDFGGNFDNFSETLRRKGKKRFKKAADERTGFTDIIFLRNIFRHYADVKEAGRKSNNLVMVFYNGREGDSWIVEPKEFKLLRDSSSPLTYKYSIMLTTLAPLSTIFIRTEDALKEVLGPNEVFRRVQEFNTSLKRTFLIVSTQIRRLEGLGVFAETQLLNPIINVIRGLGVIRATGETFGNSLRANTQRLFNELDEAIALLTGTPGVEEQDALVRSLRRAQVTSARILAEPGVRETVSADTDTRQQRYQESYTTGGDSFIRPRITPNVGSSAAFIGNNPTTGTVAQDYVQIGEDIRALAGRLLGDRTRWHILVTMNSLVAPYVAEDGRKGVLAAGDPILYPSTDDGVADESVNSKGVTNSETESETEFQPGGLVRHAYGRDFRLRTAVSADGSGVELSDIRPNQRGDASTIVGVPNVEQAMVLKFITERGELPAHPGYGASFPLGKKATPESINQYRVNGEATILSDPRVSTIKSLDFGSKGDILFARAEVVLLNQSDALATTVALRGK